MNSERKKLYLYAMINFLFGIITGIILFYGSMRSGEKNIAGEFAYDKSIGFGAFMRVCWLNIMWMICVFMMHNILPLSFLYIALWVRGVASGFSTLYMLEFMGMKEAIASVFPQCISVLPMLIWFSVACVEKRKKLLREGREPFLIKQSETALVFLLSLISGVIEMVFFNVFCRIL